MAVCFCVLDDNADCRLPLYQIAFEERSARKSQQMNIFEVHHRIAGDYAIYIRNFISISDGENCDGTSCILDSFSFVERRGDKNHGRDLTKRTILEIYDALAEFIQAGKPRSNQARV